MGASAIFNLLIGPLGQSFKIIKERGKLFEEKDFTELSESQYALYEKKVGKLQQAIYCIGIDEETKEYEIVNEDEKEALLLGSRFIRETVGGGKEQLPADSELIEEFAARFDLLVK